MSIFNAAARRSVGLESRIEDTSIIYNSDLGTFFIENQYKGFNYHCRLTPHYNSKLLKDYLCPDISFFTVSDIINFKSLKAQPKYILLKDRNGEKKLVKKIFNYGYNCGYNKCMYNFYHEYNDDGDYKVGVDLSGNRCPETDIPGHKYTLNEIEHDCHAFIDNIYEEYEYEQSQN